MYLARCQELGLLEPDHSTNILLDFSLPVKKILVREVTTFLLEPSFPVSQLSSPAHVHWAMETCGQGFALPIEEEESIQRTMELYRRWALEPRARPPPIHANLQLFMQRIIMHSSLLFGSRSLDPVVVDRHSPLCAKMLEIYQQIGRQLGSQLSVETWEIFLNLLLGIGDSLLHVKPGPETRLGDSLCQRYLSVLFELWLTSQTRNPAMWKALGDRARLWVNLAFAGNNIVQQWTSTCLSLLDRSLGVLYSTSAQHGTPSVILTTGSSSKYELKFPRDYVFYAWHKLLHVLGDLNRIHHSNIFLTGILGVEAFVSHLLAVSDGDTITPPDGNTILHVFGQWLFQASHGPSRTGFEEGISHAFSILLRVFLAKAPTTRFLPIYLARFYESMQQVLLTEGRVLLSVLAESEEFFSANLQGSLILAPYFLSAISKVLSGRIKAFPAHSPQHVRHACLKILASLLCIPNHFPNVKICVPDEIRSNGDVFAAAVFEDLKPYIAQTILTAINTEVHPANIEMVLHLVLLYSAEDIQHSTKFTTSAILQILNKLASPVQIEVAASASSPSVASSSGATLSTQNSSSSLPAVGKAGQNWTCPVLCTALRTISSLSQFYRFLGESVGQQEADGIVTKLCKYIKDQCSLELPSTPNQTSEAEVSNLVAQAFYTIVDWIMVDQWLFDHNPSSSPGLIQALMEAIVIGLEKPILESLPEPVDPRGTSSSSRKKPKDEKGRTLKSKTIRHAARFTLLTIFNQIGNFPTPRVGTASLSSLITEQDILQSMHDAAQSIRSRNGPLDIRLNDLIHSYVLNDNTLVTLIDRPFGRDDEEREFNAETDHPLSLNPDGPHVTMFIRNEFGKYVWDLTIANMPIPLRHLSSPTLELVKEGVPVTATPFVPRVQPISEEYLSEICAYLDKRYKGNSIIEMSEAQYRREADLFANANYNLNCAISVFPSSAPSSLHACAASGASLAATPQQSSLASSSSSSSSSSSASSSSSSSTSSTFLPVPLSRAFLAQLGLFDLSNWERCEHVEMNSVFWNKIQLLDSCHERTCLKIAVQYLAAGVLNEEENEVCRPSPDYQDFISSLGWGVSVDSHPGYLGGFQSSNHAETAASASSSGGADELTASDASGAGLSVVPTFANHRSDFVFHVETLLPDSATTRHLLQSATVRVVWMESRLDLYRVSAKPASPARILIHPLPNGLFHTRILVHPSQNSSIGPLSSSAILSKNILGIVVRETAESLYRFFSVQNSKNELTPAMQIQKRKDIIRNLVEQCRRSGNLEPFYTGMLSSSMNTSLPSGVLERRNQTIRSSGDQSDAKGGRTLRKEPRLRGDALTVPFGNTDSSAAPEGGEHVQSEKTRTPSIRSSLRMGGATKARTPGRKSEKDQQKQ